jgi:hypothetical protein
MIKTFATKADATTYRLLRAPTTGHGLAIQAETASGQMAWMERVVVRRRFSAPVERFYRVLIFGRHWRCATAIAAKSLLRAL